MKRILHYEVLSLVPLARFELTTSPLGGERSIQLSYKGRGVLLPFPSGNSSDYLRNNEIWVVVVDFNC